MTSRARLALRTALVLALVPLAAGRLVVTYQDAVMTHLPTKAASVALVRGGEWPMVNPYASYGQPLAGNPNFGTFFPDMLLFLALPLPVAFGLRFALSALLAFAGARRWARAEGRGRAAAEVAGWAFLLSGVYVSAWRFFNTALAVAIAPWVLAAAARLAARSGEARGRVRAAAAELGLWSGLEVLAGEPVVALLAFAVAGARAVLLAPSPRRALPWAAAGFALGAAVAAPQIASTAQVYPTSTRSLAPFPYGLVTSTSVEPPRLLELAVPYPFGRPDLTGPDGFTGHAYHDNHAPYLWTLHLGLATLALLVLFGRAFARGERAWWTVAAGGIVLSFGRGLPGAKLLAYPLSLGGRVRFPVKWWYVVVLALVPLVALAAARWEEGAVASRVRRGWAAALAVAAAATLALTAHTPLATLATIVAVLATAGLVLRAGRTGPRSAGTLALLLVLPLALADLPLLRALLDRPPDAPPRFQGGRIYDALRVEAHPSPHDPSADPPEKLVREVFRRATRELWPLTGALSGMPYAFDRDPDGVYAENDRVFGKVVASRPWSERATALRRAGVAYVVADEDLPPPFERLAFLAPEHAVRLYHLGEAAPSVRLATRLVPAGSVEAAFDVIRGPGFDVATDAVVPGDRRDPTEGAPSPASLTVDEERATRLAVRTEASGPALVVWSRTHFAAWRATVDGASAPVVLADGHLVGVRVPAGRHQVRVAWATAPVAFGLVLSLLGLGGCATMSRRRSGGT